MARLKCPNCSNIITAAAGTTPTCPACGFRGAQATTTPFSPLEQPTVTGPAQRPGWTTTAVVLQFISGGFATLVGLVLLVGGSAMARFIPGVGGDIAGTILGVIGAFILVFGILYLLLATQVAKGRNWARITSIVLSSISGFFTLLGIVGGNVFGIFSLAFDVLIIVGLALPVSAAWFAHQEATRQSRGMASA